MTTGVCFCTKNACSERLLSVQDDQVKPYDTVVLPAGMYKQRVLCSKPVKLISQASWHARDHDQHVKTTGSSITADTVIFWQERAPAILVNADAVCLHNITVKVEAAAHEYSSVAYGPCGRAITMKQCTVMGSTGLRVPYTLDPLTVLLLKMQGCTIQVVIRLLLHVMLYAFCLICFAVQYCMFFAKHRRCLHATRCGFMMMGIAIGRTNLASA